MGRFDKDRFLKELAVRYCLTRGAIPFLEVVVHSVADLSDTVEVLTDLDVLGIEAVGDGGLRRIIFDCKTKNRMSSVNRSFWAAGVKDYTGCDEAFLILKAKAVHNHRISALAIDVDLHDEESFKDLGRTADPAFPRIDCYQASIERWNAVHVCYENNRWAENLYDLARNVVPLTKTPWSTFRRILAELRNARGFIDPEKGAHIAVFLDVLASAFVLWAAMGRDIRRFYEPTMVKPALEKVLRYYLWGGKESYKIRQKIEDFRQQIQDKATPNNVGPVELPAWDGLVSFVGLIVSAPQNILECAHVCRELSIRMVSSSDTAFDKALSERLKANSRIRQFSVGLSDYLVAAGKLPKDMATRVQTTLFDA